MKNILRRAVCTFLSVFVLLSIVHAQKTRVEMMNDLLDGIILLDEKCESEVISKVNELASSQSDSIIELSKENVNSALLQIDKFLYCLVTVSNHTVVKVMGTQDCIQSGSWKACMPLGEGFVSKNGLIPVSDYLNNILGRPDDGQPRKMYLFHSMNMALEN